MALRDHFLFTAHTQQPEDLEESSGLRAQGSGSGFLRGEEELYHIPQMTRFGVCIILLLCLVVQSRRTKQTDMIEHIFIKNAVSLHSTSEDKSASQDKSFPCKKLVDTSGVLIFLHFQKSGGTTLEHTLIKNARMSGKKVDRPDTSFFRKLQKWRKKKAQESDILMGHSFYGIHNALRFKKFVYITMLRNPVERALSYYFHSGRSKCKGCSVLHHVKLHSLNYFANRLVPSTSLRTPVQPMKIEQYHVAKQILSSEFTSVGIMERYEESMVLLERLDFGMGNFSAVFCKSCNSYTKAPISAQVKEKIRRVLEMEMNLYDFAVHIFEQQIGCYGSTFNDDLAAFRIRQNENLRTCQQCPKIRGI